MTFAVDLAAFVHALRDENIPSSIQHEAKRSILNFIGTALSGWVDPAAGAMLDVLQPLSGPGTATIIGSDVRADMLNAAFMNALTANLLDFDDTHMPTIIHPSAPVAPPLFALAERSRMSGPALLTGFAAGVEVACRLGRAVSPEHYTKGWHITATCGIFGAAAASAKALGLDAAQTAHALGIAASQSSGLVANLTHGAKNVQVGHSARNGLFAALVAQKGYTAAADTIEGPRGWAATTGVAPDPTILLGGLGDNWELSRNTYKASPCGIVLAPVIDAALALRHEHAIRGEAVDRVIVSGHPLLLVRADRPVVRDERDAKLSLQHSVAVAIATGKAGVEEFSRDAVENPVVAALRARVTAVATPDCPVEEARVCAQLKDGRTVEVHIRAARGSLAKPLSDTEIADKVRELARLGAPGLDVSRLIDAVWAMDRLADAGSILALTRPGGSR